MFVACSGHLRKQSNIKQTHKLKKIVINIDVQNKIITKIKH